LSPPDFQEGDLFHRIRDRAKAKQYFSESEVMDMFVQVTCPNGFLQGAAELNALKTLCRHCY